MSGCGAADRGPAGPVTSPAFVGREDALAAVVEALRRGPALVLIEGEAGIGKTRLLREVLAGSGPERPGPGRVLVATCPPLRESLTLGPIVDAVRQARDGVRDLRLSGLAGALRPLYPEWAEDLPPAPERLDDAKAARHRLFRALAELIGRLDATTLVVEDVHWADESTLEFLLYLASLASLSLIVTYRPEDVPAGSLLRRLSSRQAAGATVARVALPPLGVSETAALVSSMLDSEPVSAAFATFLHERTAGLPLAIEESVRLLRDRADLVRDDGEWIRRSLAELQVPPTVRDAVLERVQRLGVPAQAILAAAAVLADPAEAAVLVTVSGEAAEPARRGLTEALESGLLHEQAHGPLAYRHALAAKAVYEATPVPERQRLHRRAGQALEAIAPRSVAQLAHHFRQAGDLESWASYAEMAAELAVASGDHDTAAAGLHDVLVAAGAALPVPVRGRLAIMLGHAVRYCRHETDGLHDRIAGTLREVLDTGGLGQREQAGIRLDLARMLSKQGRYEEAAAEIELAVPHLGHAPCEQVRAMQYLALPLAFPWPLSRHLQWLRRADEVDVSGARPVDRLGLTTNRTAILLCLGRSDGWAATTALPDTSPSVEERREIIRARVNFGSAALIWGRYREARQHLTAARTLADRGGSAWDRQRIESTFIELDWNTGAWDGMAERLASAIGGEDAYLTASHSAIPLVAGLLAGARGEWADAERHLRRGTEFAAHSGQAHVVADIAGALAGLWLAQGLVDEALRATDEPLALIATKRGWIWATDLAPARVEALVAAGRTDEATRLVRTFAAGLGGREVPAPRAALALCRAMLVEATGEPGRAAAAFERAARLWAQLPRPYHELRGRERQGRCLLAAGRAEPAQAVLSHVQRGFAGLGARADADRVAHELRRHGVSVPRPWRGGRTGYGDQLSPRELEVVRLVVAGKTNAQIARTLSRSQPTIATQLRSAMRKLDVSSRTALAVKAVADGLGGA